MTFGDGMHLGDREVHQTERKLMGRRGARRKRRGSDARKESIRPLMLIGWSPVLLGGKIHLVGLLEGGDPIPPCFGWIVTSPVTMLDLARNRATTERRDQVYDLWTRYERLMPPPAIAAIDQVIRAWRLKEPPPTGAMSDADLTTAAKLCKVSIKWR